MYPAVIMPVYNQAHRLERSLDSLAAQTDNGFCAICVDDGSTDGSSSKLDAYLNRASFDLTVLHKKNGGVSSARNMGLSAAFARKDVTHIMFLDADDVYHPQCVELVRAAVRKTPDAAIEYNFTYNPSISFAMCRYGIPELQPVVKGFACNVWQMVYPVWALQDTRFFEGTDVAEDIAYNFEVRKRSGIQVFRLPVPLYGYMTDGFSAMRRPLEPGDFIRRVAVLDYLVSVVSDDPKALRSLASDELPDMLRQFMRHLSRVPTPQLPQARRILGEGIRSLRERGLLRPKSFAPRWLRDYFRLRWLEWKARGMPVCCR